MKNLNRIVVSAILVAGAISLNVACSSEVASETEQGFGHARIPLTTTSALGQVYRLRFVVFTIENVGDPTQPPISVSVPNSRDTYQLDLPIGTYSVLLETGWRLQRQVVAADGTISYSNIAEADRLLVSANPQTIAITEGAVSTLNFMFRVGEDLIEFGAGRLDVVVTVDDTEAAECVSDAECTDGFCDLSTSECVECLSDSDCTGGLCDPSASECVTLDIGFADPGFMASPTPWTVTGNAVVDTAETGNADVGVGHFSPTAVCEGGNISQTLDLSWALGAGPHELTFRKYVGIPESGLDTDPHLGAINVSFDSIRQSTPESGYRDEWRERNVCLGERAYQPGVQLGFDAWPLRDCTVEVAPYDRIASVSIDNVGISPSSDCPNVGEVRNGDFEAGDTGWTQYSNAGARTSIDTSSGDYAADLRITNPCAMVRLEGMLSVPLPTTLATPALQLTLDGTRGDALLVSMGEQSPVAELSGAGAQTTLRVCIPGWAQGLASKLRFLARGDNSDCAAEVDHHYVLDDLSIVSAPACAGSDAIADGGFEVSTNPGFAPNWHFTSQSRTPTNASVAIEENAAWAHSGRASLKMVVAQECAVATATTTYLVPDSAGSAGPALRFWYKHTGEGTTARIGTELNLPTASTYTEHITCLDPALSGTAQTVQVSFHGGGSGCSATYAPALFRIDDIEPTTHASCPTF